jgi:hypothetical protein
MGRSLIQSSSLRRSLIDKSQIQAKIETMIETQAITSINSQKNELIQIMNDYLTQKITRIVTTDKLNTLHSKIA